MMIELKDFFTYTPETPLLFTNIQFWVFMAIILLFYQLVYTKNKLRNIYLLSFSLFFYYKSSGFYFFLLIFSTLSDYFHGLFINKTKQKTKRRLLLTSSVIINLSLLFYYKYAYLTIDFINGIFGTNFIVKDWLSVFYNSISGGDFSVESIFLPVGISFFTFQTISYSVDIYREKISPVKSILDFGFYVSFFPQLVAGPIVRASEFIPQLYKKYSLSINEFGHAVFLVLNGLIKKIIISDYISVNFVDRVFDTPLSYSGAENLLATYGYSLQIYCDFSGYTDIAIGVALLLGYRLPINFLSPYKATSVTDFWHRWHISLSSWLKDYLYISLGGNRKGKIRMYINLLATMLLGGLWHGASLKFIIWGGLHGIALGFHKILIRLLGTNTPSINNWQRAISVIFTFHFVSFCWIFFRANNFKTAILIFKQIFTNLDLLLFPQVIIGYHKAFILMLIGFLIHWLPVKIKEWYRGLFIKTPLYAKIAITILVVFLVFQAKSSDLQPFIYFQF